MTCDASKLLKIIQGTDVTFGVRLITLDCNKCENPVDVTPYDTIHAIFLKTDGSKITKSTPASGGITVLSAAAGKIAVSLSAAETILMPEGESQSFEVELYKDFGLGSQTVSVVQFLEVLKTVPRLEA